MSYKVNNQTIHDYTCNECKKTPIIGTRWFCFICRKNGQLFNLCNVCKIANSNNHNHPLESVKYSSRNPFISYH